MMGISFIDFDDYMEACMEEAGFVKQNRQGYILWLQKERQRLEKQIEDTALECKACGQQNDS